ATAAAKVEESMTSGVVGSGQVQGGDGCDRWRPMERHVRLRLPASVVLTIAFCAAPISSAFAQAPSCIPSGEGAAPYTGDWTRIPRAERIALCQEGQRREEARPQETEQAWQRERAQERKEADAAPRAAQKVPEQTAGEPQGPPERGRRDGAGPI